MYRRNIFALEPYILRLITTNMGQRQFARRRKRFQIRITYHTNYVNQKGV